VPLAAPVLLWALLTAGCVVVVGALAGTSRGPDWVVAATALAFLPYALLVTSAPPDRTGASRRLGLGLAVFAGAALVAAPSALSDDLYRYLWDGRVLRHGFDPYRYAPDAPALAALRDPLWGRVNHPGIPTIYPPLAQGLFALADAIDHAPWSIKALGLGAHLASTLAVDALARGGGLEGRAPLLFALNPLALVESALGGHVDAVVGLAVALAALALVRGRVGPAVLAVAAASGLKLVGIVLSPLLARRSRVAALLALGLALAPVAALAGAGQGSGRPPGLSEYGMRWQGNAGAFVVIEAAVGRALEAGWGVGAEQVAFPALRPLLLRARGGRLDPWSTLVDEKKGVPDPSRVRTSVAAGLLARLLVAAFVLALALGLAWRGLPPVLATRWVLLSTLLLAPQVHPWYLLWLLPVEVAAGRFAGLVWSAAVLVAYAPLAGWQSTRTWAEPGWAVATEYGLVLLFLAWETWAVRREGARGAGAVGGDNATALTTDAPGPYPGSS